MLVAPSPHFLCKLQCKHQIAALKHHLPLPQKTVINLANTVIPIFQELGPSDSGWSLLREDMDTLLKLLPLLICFLQNSQTSHGLGSSYT